MRQKLRPGRVTKVVASRAMRIVIRMPRTQRAGFSAGRQARV